MLINAVAFGLGHQVFLDYAPLLSILVVSIPSRMVAEHLQKEQASANQVLEVISNKLIIIREDVQVQADMILEVLPPAQP